jgi:hypothetical protein
VVENAEPKGRPPGLTSPFSFALAATFVSASFAGEFTVHQGKRYRATISLKSVEHLADNALIASKFRAFGSQECMSRVQVRYVGSKASGQSDHASSDHSRCSTVILTSRAGFSFWIAAKHVRYGVSC